MQDQVTEPPVGTVEEVLEPTRAELPEVGVTKIVFAVEAATAVVYVMVMTPVASAIATEATLFVAAGEVHPEEKADALAAFSATATLAEPANDNPSVTFARTV